MADKNDKNNTDNVSQFPDEIERLKRLEQKLKAEKSKQKPPSEPVLNIPTGVKWMSVVFIGAFLITYFANTDIANTLFRYLAFLPPLYENPSQGPFYLLATMPFTHTLLHGGWFHLAINVAMLLAFGSAVEKYIGTKRLIIIFLVSSALGALTHLMLFWGDSAALIGASGGISGLFGALLRILQDHGQMKPGWRGLMPITLLWVGVSVLFALFSAAPGGGEIAWAAHVGGFLGGLVLYRPLYKLVK
tara:strand:- start:1536 stop:2273 length:738 start_codon:yes stop_codon:yes gene_type:complete